MSDITRRTSDSSTCFPTSKRRVRYHGPWPSSNKWQIECFTEQSLSHLLARAILESDPVLYEFHEMRSNDQPPDADQKLITKQKIQQLRLKRRHHIPSAGNSSKDLLQKRPRPAQSGNSSGNAIFRDLVPLSEKLVGTICT